MIGRIRYTAELTLGFQRVLGYIEAVDQYSALSRLYHSRDRLDGRGFTGAVMTDKAGYRAVLSGKRDIVDNGIIAVLLGEIIYLNQFDPLLCSDILPAADKYSYQLYTPAVSHTYQGSTRRGDYSYLHLDLPLCIKILNIIKYITAK